MEEIDQNKLIAKIVTSNIEGLFSASKKFLSDTSQSVKARISSTFSSYITTIKRKYSSTKTIIYRDTPQSIEKFYEPIDLYNDTIDLPCPNITDLINIDKPIIITGTGGSGKSTFLKYLLLNSIQTTKHIPIFVELRDVEQDQTSLLDYITASLQVKNVNLEQSFLQQAFKSGKFIFFLDGFDELSHSFAGVIGDEIDQLTQDYPKCTFIVTSRPGQEFISWSTFLELHTKPLTKDKAVSLVKRLNFDLDVKNKFIQELETELYDSHRSFFENPLLLSIMLITYRDSASIPSELHNFYGLAFEALYYRHDASKSFKRPTLTELPVNKGKDILSAFSLVTYIKSKTSFNKSELNDFLQTAMKLSDCECNLNDLTTDLMRAFCMLLQDGTVYEYTHRSFQEYFAAYYLIAASEQNQLKLIQQFSKKADTDITLQLAYGMNPKLIEEKLIVPFLEDFKNRIGYKGRINKIVFRKFAKEYFDKVTIHPDRSASLNVQREKPNESQSEKSLNLGLTRLIIRIYGIDTLFRPNNKNKLPEFKELQQYTTSDKERHRLIQLTFNEAFKIGGLLDWFLNHSIESRVLNRLMELEENLKLKSEKNNDLFLKLLENN
jgi:hypothetical protein